MPNAFVLPWMDYRAIMKCFLIAVGTDQLFLLMLGNLLSAVKIWFTDVHEVERRFLVWLMMWADPSSGMHGVVAAAGWFLKISATAYVEAILQPRSLRSGKHRRTGTKIPGRFPLNLGVDPSWETPGIPAAAGQIYKNHRSLLIFFVWFVAVFSVWRFPTW